MSRRPGLRRALAEEAARLMVDEDIREYIEAKHIAADNLLGMRAGPPITLPSNGEIRAAIVSRARWTDAASHSARLAHLRRVAIDLMAQLEAFLPRLIGSVASGDIHRHSDIDLQLFTDERPRLERCLREHGHPIDRVEKQVVKDGQLGDYVHYHLEVEGAPVELSVYAPGELFVTRFSSIDGKPIDRLTRRRVEGLLRG